MRKMGRCCGTASLVAVIAVLVVTAPGLAQGKGGEKGKDKGEKPQKAHVQEKHPGERGKPAKVAHAKDRNEMRGGKAEKAVEKKGTSKRIAAGALTRGHARGLDDDDVVIRQTADHITLLNRAGILLVDLDEERARNLGHWRVRRHSDDLRSNAPSFCRSGEGHPVFGREWCIQKGFGLGRFRDVRWGRTIDVGDVIFRQADRGTLARAVLIDVLGDVVFNRLGLHALTLGYSDPLTGVWLGEPTGPQVLRISSGGNPIAELYDGNRDNRADALIVALRPW